jgi:hypothetical protein
MFVSFSPILTDLMFITLTVRVGLLVWLLIVPTALSLSARVR